MILIYLYKKKFSIFFKPILKKERNDGHEAEEYDIMVS